MATARKTAAAPSPSPVQPAVKAAPKRVAKPKVGAAPKAPKATAPVPAPAKAAPKAPAKLAKPAKAAKPPKVEKPKKPKLVRDSFTIPKAEYEVLDALKQRAARAGSPAKKSELLRAGIKALAAMSEAALLAALKAVPSIKTGRPAKA